MLIARYYCQNKRIITSGKSNILIIHFSRWELIQLRRSRLGDMLGEEKAGI